ncbi:hypothetical protein MMC14_009888 [Varicellaria rhodocarpa]|nr:hypothetical protein [Varicellaria rhodocarpa]
MHFSRVLVALAAGASFVTAIPAVSPTQHPLRPTKTKSPIKHSPTSGPGGNLKAVDISVKQSASFWTCLAKTYQKVVIRGYQQACGSGGAVDKNFVASYNAAKAAGIQKIDAYMFPCTGTQPNGVKCKPPTTQLAEFEAVIANNGMQLDYVWFDVEPTTQPCAAWNLVKADNLALAKEYTAMLRQSSLNWGVYGNGNQWSGIFPSRSSDIGSDLPLWAVQDDHKPGASTVTTFMGGWTKAVGKQYSEDVQVCGGGVDQDSFSS